MLVVCLEMDLPGLAIILQAVLTPETGQRKAAEGSLQQECDWKGHRYAGKRPEGFIGI